MIDLIAAMVNAVTKWLNRPPGLATGLPLLPVFVSAVIAYLRSGEVKSLFGFVRFMAPIDTLTHASARAGFLFWISRKLLMLLVTVPAGASIDVACGYVSHALSATAFGNTKHVSRH